MSIQLTTSQCDEKYPCNNCVKHAIPCSLSQRNVVRSHDCSQGSQEFPVSTTHIASPTLASSDSNPDLFDLLPGSRSGAPVLPKGDWMRDLELMHHFCTVTCDTLAIRADVQYTWRVVVPIEGYANEFVMHGILAISALHRAYLFPSQRSLYVESSDYHQACGLQIFRSLISSPIAPEDRQSVFCFASMVTVSVCAVAARSPDSHLPCPISNAIELFGVIRGIESIIAPFFGSIRKSRLAPFLSGVWLHEDGVTPRSEYIGLCNRHNETL